MDQAQPWYARVGKIGHKHLPDEVVALSRSSAQWIEMLGLDPHAAQLQFRSLSNYRSRSLMLLFRWSFSESMEGRGAAGCHCWSPFWRTGHGSRRWFGNRPRIPEGKEGVELAKGILLISPVIGRHRHSCPLPPSSTIRLLC